MAQFSRGAAAAPPVVLPSSKTITALTLRDNVGPDQQTITIDDPEQIAKFVAFVNARNDGWIYPPLTYPTHRFAVGVQQQGQIVAIVSVTKGGMGGQGLVGDPSQKRTRSLSEEEWQELRGILDLDAKYPEQP